MNSHPCQKTTTRPCAKRIALGVALALALVPVEKAVANQISAGPALDAFVQSAPRILTFDGANFGGNNQVSPFDAKAQPYLGGMGRLPSHGGASAFEVGFFSDLLAFQRTTADSRVKPGHPGTPDNGPRVHVADNGGTLALLGAGLILLASARRRLLPRT